MIFSVVVLAIACAGLIVSALFFPAIRIKGKNFPIYFLPALLGSVALLVFRVLPWKEAWQGLTAEGEMNPIKILSLFLSLTFLSVFLDELGFFKKLATAVAGRAKGSQVKFFFLLYALVSVLTVFTSNDIVVLTFTPFICLYAKEEGVSPLPYLVGEFVAANTWSMMLVIGNPTNIYLSSACGIGFLEYLKTMWLPTLLAGASALFTVFLLFQKKLKGTGNGGEKKERSIADRFLLIVGIVHLGGTVVLLAISSYVHLPMWAICVGAACSLLLISAVYSVIKGKEKFSFALRAIFRAPWEIVPFVLSMFLIVLSLEKYGATDKIARLLSGKGEWVRYALASFFSANLINNIPMSVLFGGVLSGTTLKANVFAVVIGSNLGAYLTPVGALAGIMWTGLIKVYGVKFSVLDFIRYGGLCAVVALAFSLLGLMIVV